MVSYKKAISPVVATALLLVVAVVAVVGFQSWFTTYQSGINVKVEQESDAGSSVTIERLELGPAADEVKIYVKNNANAVVNVTLDVPALNCTESWVEVSEKSVGSLVLDGCVTTGTDGTAYDVVAVSANGVFSASMIAR